MHKMKHLIGAKNKQEKKTLRIQRAMSYLLTTAMLVGGLGLSPLAAIEVEAAPVIKNVNLGYGGIRQGQDKLGSQIYFASKGTPIAWHAMANQGESVTPASTLTLLADDVVNISNENKCIKYYRENVEVLWTSSDLCEWH